MYSIKSSRSTGPSTSLIYAAKNKGNEDIKTAKEWSNTKALFVFQT